MAQLLELVLAQGQTDQASKSDLTQNNKIMKTVKNTSAKIFKAFTALTLAAIITIAPAMANGNKDKNNEKLSVEDSLMIEELQVIFNLEDELSELNQSVEIPSFQVFDTNDHLIFSGSKTQWNDQANKKLTMIKRKAEFMFNADGTQIYKIF